MLLAAEADGSTSFRVVFQTLPWIVLCLAFIAAGSLLLMWVRRRLRRREWRLPSTAGESLSAYRQMHERGMISDAEYANIRRNLAARAREEQGDKFC